MRDRGVFASTSVTRHLTRGAIGFGLIGAALVLTASVGPTALLLAPLGMVALRGCPMCWTVGLLQTISGGRLGGGACALSSRAACGPAPPPHAAGATVRMRTVEHHHSPYERPNPER